MAYHTDKLKIEQTTNPFIDFIGTETSDITKNLSTLQGTGTVDAPKSTAWTFSGMVKIRVKDASNNLVEKWVPCYKPTS